MITVTLERTSQELATLDPLPNPVVVFNMLQFPLLRVPGVPGPQGPPGVSLNRRHAWASPNSYCGYAPTGSQESDEVWTITRITVAGSGDTTTATATEVNWTDYLTHNYQ